MPKKLFLSHSGVDTEAARQIKSEIEKRAGSRLEVWLDVDELPSISGRPWRDGIDQALSECDSFAVVVGSLGLRNWVRAETDVALARAVKEPDFRLVPILMDGATSKLLDPFSARFQAVRDPLQNPAALVDLVNALGGTEDDQENSSVGRQLTTERPFPGLTSMDAVWEDRFFGRQKETETILAALRHRPLFVLWGDSGAGKSSLAMAGVGSGWRGGALADDRPAYLQDLFWNVIRLRPGRDPIEALRQEVTRLAQSRGLHGRAEAMRAQIAPANPSETLYALEADLPAGHVRTLLIIDQAEELWGLSEAKRIEFIKLLAGMLEIGGESGRLKVLVTIRYDHLGLFMGLDDLADLTSPPEARMRLNLPDAQCIDELIRLPLAMANYRDRAQTDELIQRVMADMSERAGDLALVQLALSNTWRDRELYHGSLVGAYGAIGGVPGALAAEARRVKQKVLTPEQGRRLVPVFLRLIELGETTGATRRIADLKDFSDEDKELIQTLASEEAGWLLQISGETVEVSHEAIITQWPDLVEAIKKDRSRLWHLPDLIRRAKDWVADRKRSRHAPAQRDLETFESLENARPDVLIEREKSFIGWARRRLRILRAALGAVVATIGGLAIAIAFLLLQVSVERLQAEADRIAAFEAELRASQEASAAEAARQAANTAEQRASQEAASALASQQAAEEARAESERQAAAARDALQRAEDANLEAQRAREEGVAARQTATALLSQTLMPSDPVAALKLAIAAWPAAEDATGAPAPLFSRTSGAAISEARQKTILDSHEGSVTSVAFSPDGALALTGSSDGTARLWDVARGTEVRRLSGRDLFVSSLAFSPEGTLALTGSIEGTIRLLDVKTGAEVWQLSGHEAWLNSVAFSPDGALALTGSEDGTARLWDVATGAEVGLLSGHGGEVWSVAFSPDGALALTGSVDETARLWDLATGAEVQRFSGHEGTVSSVAFSQDGALALTGSIDRTARLWDVATGVEVRRLSGHESGVNSVAFSPDGFLALTGSDDRTARLWAVETGAEVLRLFGHRGGVESVAFSPDGSLALTGSSDGTARIWDVASEARVRRLSGHEGAVESGIFSPDGAVALTGSEDGTVRHWHVATGAEVRRFSGRWGSVFDFAFSQDGALALTGSADGTARLWDVATGTEVLQFSGHQGMVSSVAFSPDGALALTGSNGTARIWDTATGAEVLRLSGHEGLVLSVAFSQDGSLALTGSDDGTARLWDLATRAGVRRLSGHEDRVLSVAFSPDGALALTGSADDTARLWDVATGAELRRFSGHEDSVISVAFSPNGALALTGSADNTARLWDVATGAEVRRFSGHDGRVLSVAFSPDGSLALTGSDDGTARLWDVGLPPGDTLLERACNALPFRNGARDISMVGLGAEIGLELPDLTVCLQ